MLTPPLGKGGCNITLIFTDDRGSKVPEFGLTQYSLGAVVLTLKHKASAVGLLMVNCDETCAIDLTSPISKTSSLWGDKSITEGFF